MEDADNLQNKEKKKDVGFQEKRRKNEQTNKIKEKYIYKISSSGHFDNPHVRQYMEDDHALAAPSQFIYIL